MTYKEAVALLELPNKFQMVQVKKQYRILTRKWHPDVNKSDDAEKHMMLLNSAYEFLSDERNWVSNVSITHISIFDVGING